MNKLIIIMLAFSLMILPFAVYGQSEQTASNVPPVSQSLVPEGDFALKLAPALKLGTATNEAQAEDMLSSVGIAPKNGWIADYPMTPIIIGELQRAVVNAADAHKLPIGKDEALSAFQGLTTEFGLAVVPGSPGQYAEDQPQPNPTVINNYYYEEGPPIITYYQPPWDYYYLYAWVPYPFWCSGFFFPGFFILNDFDTVVVFGHHHHHFRVTNHFFDRRINRFVRVDPTTRTFGRTANASVGHTQGFVSPEARKAAGSIFNRSFERTNRSMTSPPGNTGRQHEMYFHKGPRGSFNTSNINHERSFNTSRVTHERSFDTPSRVGRSFGSSENFARSFGSPSRSFSAPPSSFGGFHSGGFLAGHSFGGFSGGHSLGGFSGGGEGFHGGWGGRR
jgi:hypothetical protein